MTREWRPGDRALLPVVVEKEVGEYLRVKWTTAESGVIERGWWANAADLIPDDRRPSWLPGQPGDVAEWGGERWAYGVDESGEATWWPLHDGDNVNARDDDVPADAVLVLPALTREVAEPPDLRCKCGHAAEEHDRGTGECYLCLPCRAYRWVES